MSVVRVRAPASTANIGPGFDCAAAALDLWNEVEVSEGRAASDEGHLGVRAFTLVAPVNGLAFSWQSAVPRARGLGSSAAVVALGLVAGCHVSGREPDPEELLALGLDLEGHPDNLAAALAGGVCLTWDGRIAKVAERLPATPIALVPDTTVSTAVSRAALPPSVSHRDAAHTAGRAALLGAAAVSGSGELFAAALSDRLHEPFRAAQAPLLDAVRSDLPGGALGATLSGSGPAVIVWAEDTRAAACAGELRERFGEVEVLELEVAARGAHAVDENP